MNRKQKIALTIAIDIALVLLLGGLVCAFTFDFFATEGPVTTPIPLPTPVAPAETQAPTANPTEEFTPEPTVEPTPDFPGILDAKYRELFLEDGAEPIWTTTSYQSANVYIKINIHEENRLKYWVADIYVRNIESLVASYVMKQSQRMTVTEYQSQLGALLTINTDYWINAQSKHGWFVRNGQELRRHAETALANDFCVIFRDGTMETYEFESFLASYREGDTDFEAIAARYPYHVFYFGPSLLDAQGHAKTNFDTSRKIFSSNPRSALGYYEPGHYAFICVLGARTVRDVNFKETGTGKSDGLTFTELSALCEELGLQAAYNLDGGSSSAMMFGDYLYGHNDRKLPDVLSVVDIG